MLRNTPHHTSRRAFRIQKRSLFLRLKTQQIFPAMSAFSMVIGIAILGFIQFAEAGNVQGAMAWKSMTKAAGDGHYCAVDVRDRAFCWGDNTYGQLGNGTTTKSNTPVAVDTSGVLSGKTIKSISAGLYHTCAVASDNNAYCWGANWFGQLGDNTGSDSSVPVAVSTAGALSGKTVLSLAGGYSHTCAVASDNNAYCWGANPNGQLGDNSTTNSSVPVAVNTAGVLSGKTVLKVSAGILYTCAIASDNLAYCWGRNDGGQLGDNSTTQRLVPVAVDTTGVLSGKTVTSISVSDVHTCAIASDNLAYCWGSNANGQVGDNSTTQRLVPVAVNTAGALSGKTITSLSAGRQHTCAVASDNKAYCWGSGADGRRGTTSVSDSLTAVAVDTSGVLSTPLLAQVTAGNASSCVLGQGSIYCWGNSVKGQRGNGLEYGGLVPTTVNMTGVLSGKTILSISSGGSHTCAIASDNLAYCWGKNDDGQLGNNSTTYSGMPVAVNTAGVLSGKTISSITTGAAHTCVIASDNLAYCWGQGDNGRLGNNSFADTSVPVAVNTAGVLSGKTISSITTGTSHTCVVASDGNGYCWGYNGTGQLGDNSTTQSSVPVAVNTAGVLSGKSLTSIVGGYGHTCAIASDNQSYCWGPNLNGELGDNSTTQSLVPVATDTTGALSGKTILSISVGNAYTCVIASDNQVYCWGRNDAGQIGDNTTTQRLVPTAVNTAGALSGKTVTAISAGDFHACAVASDNLAYCWGYNANAQIGDNTTTQRLVPTAVSTAGVLSGKTISAISGGYLHACAIASDNKAYCWGYNTEGQLGTGPILGTASQTLGAGVTTGPFTASKYRLYANADSITPGTSLAGTNVTAQLKNRNDSFRVRTGLSAGGGMVTALDPTGNSACSIVDNQAYCWGQGVNGELGNNNTLDASRPVAVDTSGVLAGKTILAITRGTNHACVIASDNQAYCWGQGGNGRLGNNSTSNSSVPVAVNTAGALSGKTVKAIDAGADWTCAIASDNQAYCWGANGNGRLGDNSTTQRLVPTAVNTAGVLSGKTVLKITAGNSHTCAIASDNLAYCWGANTNGRIGDNTTTQRLVPTAVNTAGVLSGKTVKAITNGSNTCVIASDDLSYCWGNNASGQVGDNSTTQRLVPTAVDTTGVLSGKTVLSILSGSDTTCAVASDNLGYCWGAGTSGQLGNNGSANSLVPVAVNAAGVLSGKSLAMISGGALTSCAITTENKAYCWGSNNNGKLGYDSSASSLVPVAVTEVGQLIPAATNSFKLQFAQRTAGSCSAQTTGFADVTGSSTIAYYTNPSVSDRTAIATTASDPTANMLTIAQQYVSSDATTITNHVDITPSKIGLWDFSLRDNAAPVNTTYCLRMTYSDGSPLEGSQGYPEITTATKVAQTGSAYRTYQNADSLTPGSPLAATNTGAQLTAYQDPFRLRVGTGGSPALKFVATGAYHTCAIGVNDQAYCWGSNGNGQLGNNSTTNSPVPVVVDTTGVLSGKTILSIATGEFHSCAVASDNQAYCWGSNGNGQLGNNSTTNSPVPVVVDTTGVLSGKTILSLSVGYTHACVVASDNQAYCWGYNGNGQLGNNSTTQSLIPVAVDTTGVLSGKTILSISTEGNLTCVIASDNQAYCWGANGSGQLGDNSTTQRLVPTAVNTAGVLSGKTVLSISAGELHTCAIASDNQAYCWGYNGFGELGDDSSTQSLVPVAVNTAGVLSGKTVLSINAGGWDHTCAIASDNQAYCWGYGLEGSLGNNSTVHNDVPVAVDTTGFLAGKTIQRVVTRSNSSCAVTSDNQAYCWGANYDGSLGDNTFATRLIPVAVGRKITAGDSDYKLQFAQRSAGTCSAQTTGFADVTAASTIAYSTNPSVADRSSIATTANDPTPNASTVPLLYVSSNTTTFTNSADIPAGSTGLFDFSLKDNSAPASTTYCLRLTYADGSPLEQGSAAFPEITTATGVLSLGFVDALDAPVVNPTFTHNSAVVNTTTYQSTTSTFSTATQKLRIFNNLATNGWSVSLSATAGPTAYWDRTDTLAKYDFNDATASAGDGADTDSLGGQLSVNPTLGSIAPQAGCSATGTSLGSSANFVEGTNDVITLMTASNATQLGCNWDLTGIGLTQTIPGAQAGGVYTIDMTATVVAL